MGSPIVFNGTRAKLLSSKGLLLKDGTTIDNDGITNFIKYSNAETGIGSWATYKNAVAATTPDGTITGTANSTFAVSADTALSGASNFLFTKNTGASRQGEGFYTPFTIDNVSKGKVLSIGMNYQIASGTYVDGDMVFYVWDVTNSRLIATVPASLQNSGIIEKFNIEFQSSIDSVSYRLFCHIPVATSSANTIRFDNFTCNQNAKAYGSAVTDWVAYTPTFTGFGTVSAISVYSKRTGDTLQIRGNFTTGTVSASTASMSLGYGGVNLNVTTTSALPAANTVLGKGNIASNSATNFSGFTCIGVPSFQYMYFGTETSTSNGYTATSGTSFPSTTAMSFFFEVPILGWSSSQVMSSDADTRVVAASIGGNATGTISTSVGSSTALTFPTINFDTHSGWSGSNYTIPVAGNYSISGLIQVAGTYTVGQSSALWVLQNGSQTVASSVPAGGSLSLNNIQLNMILKANAGDILTFKVTSAATSPSISGGTLQNNIYISRLAGPAQIAASESVVANYSDSSGQVYPATTTYNAVTFNTKEKDSHNAFNGVTGVFTAPMSGQYSVTMSVSAYNSLAAGGAYQDLRLETNGISAGITNRQNNTAASQIVTQMVTKTFSLLAGQIVTTTKGATYSVGAYVVFSSTSWNSISIARVGNY